MGEYTRPTTVCALGVTAALLAGAASAADAPPPRLAQSLRTKKTGGRAPSDFILVGAIGGGVGTALALGLDYFARTYVPPGCRGFIPICLDPTVPMARTAEIVSIAGAVAGIATLVTGLVRLGLEDGKEPALTLVPSVDGHGLTLLGRW